jgi:hypothetical protein
MSRRFVVQFSRHFYRRIEDAAIQNDAGNALKATNSARDSYWEIRACATILRTQWLNAPHRFVSWGRLLT